MQILRAFRHRHRRSAAQGGRVFRHADGRPVRPEWITNRFGRLVNSLCLPPVRFHDLRRAAASVAEVSRSALIYQHRTSEADQAIARAVNEQLEAEQRAAEEKRNRDGADEDGPAA